MFHFILNNSKDMVCWKMYNFLGPPATLYFTLLHRPDNSIIVMTVSVCLSVCLSPATSPELHAPYSPNFMCTSPTYDVHNVTLLMHLMNLMIMGTFKILIYAKSMFIRWNGHFWADSPLFGYIEVVDLAAMFFVSVHKTSATLDFFPVLFAGGQNPG